MVNIYINILPIEYYQGVQYIDEACQWWILCLSNTSTPGAVPLAHPYIHTSTTSDMNWTWFWHFLVIKLHPLKIYICLHCSTAIWTFANDTSEQSHTLKSPRSLVNASHWCLHGDFRWLTWSQTGPDSPVVLFQEEAYTGLCRLMDRSTLSVSFGRILKTLAFVSVKVLKVLVIV